MRRRGMVAAVVLAVVIAAVCGEQQSQGQECRAQRTCDKCIQTKGCSWCINPQSGDRCQLAANFNASFCNANDIRNPHNTVTLVQNEELTGTIQKNRKEWDKNAEIYQLKPQRVKLQLRKGMPQKLDIKYRRALDYPVDLYYLMDLSNSMKDDKEHLANAGAILAETMRNLTTQFTLGFGSFVDKVMVPFTNTTQLHNSAPCAGCAPPYSFRNDMKLSQDHAAFTEQVSNAQISGNLDHPEGGFDALMQAMVCTDQIGWRDKVRHILVFSTDAKFHHAGDGRLAGVVEPNDEKCHLNEDNEYTAFDKYDYPSIAQINKVAEEKNINIIFAVLQNERLYRELQQQIKTSSFGLLEEGSANVVDLIKEQYNSISSSVSPTDNSTSAITIKYSSSCKGSVVRETRDCDGISEDDEVTFNLEITANTCSGGEQSIVEVKTLEASVILEIELLCTCDCPLDISSSQCKNGGSLTCGVCECPSGFYGEECQCASGGESQDISEIHDQTSKCMASETDTRPCSGRGACKCGVCNCFKPEEVSGTYCQCNKRKCMSSNKLECSGHGTCDCNECRCNEGYSGVHCHCNDQDCIPTGSEEACSGHGKCDCGRCICDQQKNVTYTGRFCEDCLSCGGGKCKKFRDCVQCFHFGIGPLKDNCEQCEFSKAVENLDDYMYENSRLCTFEDEDGCYLNFTYRYLEATNKDEVHVQAERKCREKPPIAAIVFALIGTIVGIGVLSLILWKIFTTIHDKREYAKFLEETKRPQFNAEQNPLFIDPNTTTQNPMFEGQKH
uniref:Integrin beta n=1 Tax=Scylla paramamosain TaxID=85552 RepID=V9I2Y6_SCYPA|nr:beta-integrin [Scylla paramamosain]